MNIIRSSFFKVLFFGVFFVLFFSFFAEAQVSRYEIKGKVIDQNTQLPMQGASVFAQNTTFGVTTDAEGKFSIRLPEGGYSLAVTFSGYETSVKRVSQANSPDMEVLFELVPNVQSMDEISIVISNEVKDGWKKYGEFFKENFIGESQFAQECVITNPEVLRFYFYKKKNRLKVLASEPLLVNNFALGYQLKFAIDSFSTDYNTNTNLFIGYPLFQEMKGNQEQVNKWMDNRGLAYNGSMLHFMRSLYDTALSENDFQIQLFLPGNKTSTPVRDSVAYLNLNLVRNIANYTISILPKNDKIAVIFKEKPEQNYLKTSRGVMKYAQSSELTFTDKTEPIIVEQNGFYYDQENILTNGYLAFKKVGDLLPYDYDPDAIQAPFVDSSLLQIHRDSSAVKSDSSIMDTIPVIKDSAENYHQIIYNRITNSLLFPKSPEGVLIRPTLFFCYRIPE